MNRMHVLIAVAASATLAIPPALARTVPPSTGVARYGDRTRDHAAIMKMAGTFKVTFDMRETTPLVAGYKPYPARVSGGHEVVRAIVDEPGHVVLQHLLVVDAGGGRTMVVKHWRQDWTWQPAEVLTYVGPGRWALRPVTGADRSGAWSQTVWQTDDSPRYGGIGRWRYDDGVTRWTSDETRRPLARRDATRNPPYDHYLGTNRHVLTPDGWVHEQDNAKIGSKDGRSATFVHEYVVNTYAPATDFPIKAADDYWSRTKDYWASVHADWNAAIRRRSGLALGEVADVGSSTAHELMLLADDIVSGDTTAAAAGVEATGLIRKDEPRS